MTLPFVNIMKSNALLHGVLVIIFLCKPYISDSFVPELSSLSSRRIKTLSCTTRRSFHVISLKDNEKRKKIQTVLRAASKKSNESDRNNSKSTDKKQKKNAEEKISQENTNGGVGGNIAAAVKKSWSKRFGRKTKADTDSIEKKEKIGKNSKEKSGIFGSMGKALKRISQNKEKDKDDNVDPLLESDVTFDPKLMDPTFNSEVALAIEIRRQKALDKYELGDKIPDEFLPYELQKSFKDDKEDRKESLGLNSIISSLDDSIAYIEKQIQILKIDIRKYSGGVIPSTTEGEKRLLKLKRDLELTRKHTILDDQKQRKELAAQKRADEEKARMALARTKALEKKAKQEESLKKDVDEPVEPAESDESNKGLKAPGAMKKSLSKAVDGAMTEAKSAISNAWKNVRNDNDEWITVCPKTRISPGEVFPAVAGGIDLLVIGSKDGTKIHCIANNCPHLGTPLESGMIERRKCGKPNLPSNSMSTEDDTKSMINDGFEDCIVCPLHQTAFSLDTGEINGEWCPYPPVIGKVMGTVKTENKLPTFQMRTKGKNIQIKINSSVD